MASAAILVGGRARRFGGRDKSALVVGGRTILARQLDALAPVADDVLIVGSVTDVASGVSRSCRVVHDRVPDSGPLGGLDAALAAARDEVLILLACDMPFVTSAFLDYLVASADGVEAVVPRTDRGYHPLCAVYTRACRAAVTQRLDEQRLAMTGVIEAVRTRVIEPDDVERFGPARRLLANVNTPGEFDELEALLGHKL
ncbi:MAG TPA: molybdenum cofactor guanylyltransferase [Vicinamibacterales bacterium]|jgi:molybdopterin-guanine dinucleotide biosynthesis protein A